MLKEELVRILTNRDVFGLFQTVVNLQDAKIHGYEGLIRGPSDSPLHSPLQLFNCAREFGLTPETERVCRDRLAERFAELTIPGKLFVNVSPHLIKGTIEELELVFSTLTKTGLRPSNIVLELTESSPSIDYLALKTALQIYRKLGFEVAIDDLGEGFSSMRMLSEIRPDYVKIDMHFIQGINLDPVKQQFVRSIHDIALKAGAAVIAEGIETHSELAFVTKIGIEYGQGYLIARPLGAPLAHLSTELVESLCQARADKLITLGRNRITATAQNLCREVMAVSPTVTCNEIFDHFSGISDWDSIPVVDDQEPIGLITKHNVLWTFSKPYQRELHGKKPCTFLMDQNPLIVDQKTSLQDLSQAVSSGDKHHLINGYIITDAGKYQGMGNGQDLMREITQLQINAAKLSNPLTQLPGNVLINERVDYLLSLKLDFYACYADLDFFKPYNDVYGYQKGDDIIQLCGEILADCAQEGDFVGHIGGDDFIVLFTNVDFERQCIEILEKFDREVKFHLKDEHVSAGGYNSEDRRGNKVFNPLVSLSLGVVKIKPDRFLHTHDVSIAITDAKKQAKKIHGSSYFIEPRQN